MDVARVKVAIERSILFVRATKVLVELCRQAWRRAQGGCDAMQRTLLRKGRYRLKTKKNAAGWRGLLKGVCRASVARSKRVVNEETVQDLSAQAALRPLGAPISQD